MAGNASVCVCGGGEGGGREEGKKKAGWVVEDTHTRIHVKI